MKRIRRTTRVTPEEAAENRRVIDLVKQEFPPAKLWKVLAPLERHDGYKVTDEEAAKLLCHLRHLIADNWTDHEIAYDLNRHNGVTRAETGELWGPIHLVNLIRRILAPQPRDEETATGSKSGIRRKSTDRGSNLSKG